jgi:glycosyltransferase involved in cell wall biosynthesis
MTIETYILANNEELLMPYLMRHYLQFSKVIILESNSTDKTSEIAHDMGAEIWTYDVPDEINDKWFTDLKNNCWKESHADWVIIVDADEFVYHKNITQILKNNYSTILCPRFFNMYSEKFPTTEGQIYDEVKLGVEQFSPKAKMNVFRPRMVKDMNYFAGCHEAFPTGRVRIDDNSGLMTLHMRNLGKEFIINRNLRARKRQSELNRQMGWGIHVDWDESEWVRRYEEEMKQATKII